MTRPAHITKGDVLDDLGFSRAQASALKIKASIVEALLAEIEPAASASANSLTSSMNTSPTSAI